MSGGLLDVNGPESIPGGAICETQVSPLCPAGWAYFADDGSEGGDSCLLISPYTVSNWVQANSGCPWETHLLTVASAGGLERICPANCCDSRPVCCLQRLLASAAASFRPHQLQDPIRSGSTRRHRAISTAELDNTGVGFGERASPSEYQVFPVTEHPCLPSPCN
jgi:hypothetical protein